MRLEEFNAAEPNGDGPFDELVLVVAYGMTGDFCLVYTGIAKTPSYHANAEIAA